MVQLSPSQGGYANYATGARNSGSGSRVCVAPACLGGTFGDRSAPLARLFSIEHWRSRRMPDLRERRGETKIGSMRRRAFKRTAPNSRPHRPTQWGKVTAHPTVSVREPRHTDCPLMSALGQKQTLGRVRLMSALPPKTDIRRRVSCKTERCPARAGLRRSRLPLNLLGMQLRDP